MPEPTFSPGAKIQRIQRRLASPEAALKQIGAMMTAESQGAFREQAFGGKEWEPRNFVNVFGILADFAAGKKAPPARRFERRPALRDTGRLAASIAWRIVSTDTVEIGTNLDYAAVHQKGGEVRSATITEAVRTALNNWLKGRGKRFRAELGWLLNRKFAGQQLEADVPARPFVGVTKRSMRDIRATIGTKIMETS